MARKNKWLIRILFYIYMLYIYLTVVKHNSFYSFLLLNTFLAYIPLEVAFHMNEKQPKTLYALLFIVWLLFYPNAPYVLTDLFHLARFNPYDPQTGLMTMNLHMWLAFINLVASALACSLLGNWSIDYVTDTLQKRWGKKQPLWHFLIVVILLVISSIGIYIGRFLRLHTAYLFINPKWVTDEILSMWTPRMLIFVIFMFIIQFIIWVAMTLYRHGLNKYETDCQK